MRDSVRNQVASRLVPQGAVRSCDERLRLRLIAIGVFASFAVGFWLLLLLIPLLPILITIAVIRAKLKRGQRTAEGRAVCDQVEGFRTYLATAEADQLKFEEGEDIFLEASAMGHHLRAGRSLGEDLRRPVAMGRLPNETPYWYIGNYQMAAFNTAFLTSSLTSAATPVALVRRRRHRVWRRQLLRWRWLLRRWRRRRRQRQLVMRQLTRRPVASSG